ncbi:glycosyltransferase [Polaribacter cellanae]|uniref:Glycosyltransferase n=1 Tax=Polaribacter cellanae TaxID=2818493 RepID=A0A975CNZ4_9FLAO|nr:glycosyltransferase [Polaribacter cellanae]QTE23043.1 glycosyltransferase [Polaribacter cellanae]
MNIYNKNIVLIIKSPVLGGAERQAIGFADYAKNNFNCKVTFIATHSQKMSVEFESFLNKIGEFRVDYYGKPCLKFNKTWSINNLKNGIKTFLYLIKMVFKIRKIRPYLIIPFLNPPSKLAVLIYKFTGAKYTFWHQLGLDYLTGDYLEQIAIKKTPLFIANAESGLDSILEKYVIPQKKLICLPQYVSIKRENLNKNSIKEEFKIDKKDIVIGMISHYRLEKLQHILLEVFSNIYLKYNIHLVLLGDHSNSKESERKFLALKKKVKRLNLNNKISLLTNVPVEKILNILDIGVLLSTFEGTPNAILEYMLYGLPVVSTNHIGCKRLLINEDLLINNNIEELQIILEKLIKDTDYRKEVGDFNVNEINKYSKEKYFKKLLDVLIKNN